MKLRLAITISILLAFEVNADFRSASVHNVFSAEQASDRIIKGLPITIEQAPYMVSIRSSGEPRITVCGGTLITVKHVLTAAHCVDGYNNYTMRSIVVVAGASLRSETGIAREIAEIFLHPKYFKEMFYYDAAVLRLNLPYQFGPKILPKQSFCVKPPPVGAFLTLTGWGAKKNVSHHSNIKKSDFSNELRRTQVPTISQQDCEERYSNTYNALNLKLASNNSFFKSNICLFKENYGTCLQDSGGPALYGDKLCGIIAGSVNCEYKSYPFAITSVAAVWDFVRKTVKYK